MTAFEQLEIEEAELLAELKFDLREKIKRLAKEASESVGQIATEKKKELHRLNALLIN